MFVCGVIVYAMEIQVLVDELAALIKRPITLEDVNGNLIAYSVHEDPVDRVRLETLLRRGPSKDTLETLIKHGVYEKIHSSPGVVRLGPVPELGLTSRMAIAVRCGRNVVGYLWVKDDERSITPQDEAAIIKTARMIASNFPIDGLESEVFEPETRRIALELLSPDGKLDLNELKQKSEGIRLSPPFQVLVLHHPLPRSSYYAQTVLETVEVFLKNHNVNAVSSEYKGEVVIIVCDEPWHNVRGIALDLSKYLSSVDFRESLGIGGSYTDALGIPKSYQEAREAIQVGAQLRHADQKPFFDYGQMALYDLIQCMRDCKDHGTFGRDIVQQLIQYDRINGTELVKTLGVMLDYGWRRKAAADCLRIHPNTLDYRLRKIDDVVQRSLDDPSVRLAVHIWVKVFGYIGEIWDDNK